MESLLIILLLMYTASVGVIGVKYNEVAKVVKKTAQTVKNQAKTTVRAKSKPTPWDKIPTIRIQDLKCIPERGRK